jgi:cytochrome c553
MQRTVELQTLIPVIAVLLFVFFAIAVLAIVDSKVRIQAGERRDPFSISGIRSDHPVWAWIVSMVLWTIIGVLLILGLRSIVVGLLPAQKADAGLIEMLLAEQAAEQRRTFHNPVAPIEPGEKAVCNYCHGDYPHAKKPMVRTLLNMHTQFVGCLTCHADPDKIPEEELVFRWLNYSGIEVTGVPFGTDVDPISGGLIDTDDFYSKIVLYRRKGGEEELLEIPASRPDARDFIPMRGELTSAQQGAAKRRFHANVNAVGRFCARCHTAETESFLPLRDLGFSDPRVTALTNLNIVGVVEKYREFYIPTIFKQGMSDRQQRDLFGTEARLPDRDRSIQDSPRDWWRGRYDPRPAKTPEAE